MQLCLIRTFKDVFKKPWERSRVNERLSVMRKRFLAVLLLIGFVVFTFVSCNDGNKPPEKIVTGFSAVMNVKSGESELVCGFAADGKGSSTVVINQPEMISGLAFKWMGGRYALEYNGLFCETERLFLAEDSFANVIVEVINIAGDMQKLTFVETKDDCSVFTADTNWGKAEITAENKTGLIRQIEITGADILAEFSEALPEDGAESCTEDTTQGVSEVDTSGMGDTTSDNT